MALFLPLEVHLALSVWTVIVAKHPSKNLLQMPPLPLCDVAHTPDNKIEAGNSFERVQKKRAGSFSITRWPGMATAFELDYFCKRFLRESEGESLLQTGLRARRSRESLAPQEHPRGSERFICDRDGRHSMPTNVV